MVSQLPNTDKSKALILPPSSGSTNRRRHKIIVVAIFIFVPLIYWALIAWCFFMMSHEGTDDAYVAGHSHEISARIDNTVSNVYVNDNDHVQVGQLLVALDPTDFQDKVNVARANLSGSYNQRDSAATSVNFAKTNAEAAGTSASGAVSSARADISKAQAGLVEAREDVPKSRAKLLEADAQLERAKVDNQRFQTLYKKGAVSTSERDDAYRDYRVALGEREAATEEVSRAQARVVQAEEELKASLARLEQAQGQMQQSLAAQVQTEVSRKDLKVRVSSVEQSTASLNDALVQLGYCRIAAPVNGRVGKKSVEAGDRVEPAQPLMTIVSDYLWVVANFKETQLERMRPGQAVDIHIDAFPHHGFKGMVDSFSPGSGANFALLPSDNATGNFTKIVQRVPVKILFDPRTTKGFESLIVPGMSAVVTVDLNSRGRTWRTGCRA